MALASQILSFLRKRFRADPFFFLAIAGLLGILLGDSRPEWAVAYLAGFLVLGLGALALRQGRFGNTILLGLTILAFALAHTFGLKSYQSFPALESLHESDRGIRIALEGVVIQPGQVQGRGWQAVLRASKLRWKEKTYGSRASIVVRGTQRPPEYGDVVRLSGRLALPARPRNPGQFDYRTYLERQHLIGVLDVGSADTFQLLETGRGSWWKRRALAARDWMARAITRDLSSAEETSGILTAMVLGMREDTNPETEKPFRFSGTLHIFAVSGLHVGIFALIAWMFLSC